MIVQFYILLSIYRSFIYISIYILSSIYLSIYILSSICLSISYLSTHLIISIYLSLSIYPSIYFYISITILYLAINRSILLLIHQKHLMWTFIDQGFVIWFYTFINLSIPSNSINFYIICRLSNWKSIKDSA